MAEGLSALINDQADMKVVGNVGTVAESVTAATELNPDIVLLDFHLPDGTGPDAAAAIRGVRPAAKMIFLTREDTEGARFAAVQSGASAFLHKSRAAAEVVAAIRDVARGKILITPRTIATLLAKRRALEAQLERLTPREKEVLRLMAEGHPSRAIAFLNEIYPPGADTGDEMLTHEGEETGILLEGRLELVVGLETFVLEAGDSYYFESTKPHRFRNPFDAPARLISAATPANF